MAICIHLDLLHLSEAFLRVSMKSQRPPDLTVLKIPESHPVICRTCVSPQDDNSRPRAQHSRTSSRLGLCADFFFFYFVCGCYTLLEHICFHCSGLLFFNPLSSLLRNVVLMHRKSLLTFCFVSFCFVFCLQKKIWGDICFHSQSSSSLQQKFVWQILLG